LGGREGDGRDRSGHWPGRSVRARRRQRWRTSRAAKKERGREGEKEGEKEGEGKR
jgi:hypothetical protein